MDINQDKITLTDISISSFLTNVNDGKETTSKNFKEVKEYEKRQVEELRSDPDNKDKSDEELKRMIKSRFGVESVINRINEVSLYDSRNFDRIGIRNFRVVSKTISKDKQKISFKLEALPSEFQQNFSQFSSPFNVLQNKEDSIQARGLTRPEMIDYINKTPGTTKISIVDDSIADRDIYDAYLDAKERNEETESENFIRKNEC